MAIKEEKSIRRTQLISPWGVGSVLSLPNNNSVMIAGLDYWNFRHDSSLIIEDNRLVNRLGVEKLLMPPDYRDKKQDPNFFNVSIPAVRFPRWHYCPKCGIMQKLNFTQPYKPKCDKCKLGLIPERFVVSCDENHIDDFPIPEWMHASYKNEYNPKSCNIYRQTKGSSGDLSNVVYRCSCGAIKSMAKAYDPEEFIKYGIFCKGTMPWLNVEHSKCNKTLKTIQKGASNLWFGDIIDSIKIPTGFGKQHPDVIRVLNDKSSIMSTLQDGKPNIEMIGFVYELTSYLKDLISKDEFIKFVLEQLFFESIEDKYDYLSVDDNYKLKEYQTLIKGGGSVNSELYIEKMSIDQYNFDFEIKINNISLVHELTSTRVLRGFSRLEPVSYDDNSTKSLAKLSRAQVNWLPAVQSKGEGIFIEFDKEQIDNWATNELVIKRIRILENRMRESLYYTKNIDIFRPQFVLIHTIAHLLINEINLDSGYSTSSIRERIYCEKQSNNGLMYGILLYTSSGDSEGSLGGLVSQGLPKKLEFTFNRMLENAKWCSSDPVCIESKGQGTDSMNLAACHNCALLPETSCEHGNRLLDRALIHGTLNDPKIGIVNK